MKREILFRGKRIDNGEWIYGDLFRDKDGNTYIQYWTENKEYRSYEVDPETVGQYTNSLYFDGQKIFEGDIGGILIVPDRIMDIVHYEVAFDTGEQGFLLYNGVYKCAIDLVDVSNGLGLVIIGNIYDNPELLEVMENDK